MEICQALGIERLLLRSLCSCPWCLCHCCIHCYIPSDSVVIAVLHFAFVQLYNSVQTVWQLLDSADSTGRFVADTDIRRVCRVLDDWCCLSLSLGHFRSPYQSVRRFGYDLLHAIAVFRFGWRRGYQSAQEILIDCFYWLVAFDRVFLNCLHVLEHVSTALSQRVSHF